MALVPVRTFGSPQGLPFLFHHTLFLLPALHNKQKYVCKLPVYQKAGYLSDVKKGVSITLLVIFFLYNAGSFMASSISARLIKREMKAYIRSNPGVADASFTFNITDGEIDDPSFTWEEEGREFMYHGSMYDVVSSSQVNGKLVLKCVDDKKEKELKQLVAKMNRKSKSKLQFSISAYYIKTSGLSIRPLLPAKQGYHIPADDDIALLSLPVIAPPPNAA